ncbi:SH3 beta-barrel fold-containing protein [Spirosoma areae]
MKTTIKFTNPDRAEILRMAWQLIKKAGLSFGEALKRAWATVRLKAQMLVKPVSFFYYKDDGSERFAVGYYGAAPETKSDAKPSGTLLAIRYYDTLVQGWRSFRADRLILD